jgi:hypothetical protein
MKTLLTAVLLALALTAQAQNIPSSKVTAKTANLTLIPKGNGSGQWITCLENRIKTANTKDLLVTASLEIGLFTSTKVVSKNMVEDTAVGQAEIEVRVLVDGKQVEPGVVVFGRRTQTLSATLEGAIGSCLVTTTNLDGNFSTTVDLACVTPENVSLVLDSLQATSFSFVGVDVPQGVHTVSVQARTATIGKAQFGEYSALAFVGKGSMFVESIRLRKGDDVVLEVP